LYAIDKIVRMKLKEEDFKLNHVPTPSDSEAIPEQEAETDDIPIKTDGEQESDENFVTPPTRISAVP